MGAFTLEELEAIAAYDHQKNLGSQAALLIDPSYASVALYSYNPSGLPVLLFERLSPLVQPVNDVIPSINQWEACASKIKLAIQKYYIYDKEIDPSVAGLSLTASDLMNLYRTHAGDLLEDAFLRADVALNSANIPPEYLRILFIGSMANFFPAEAITRFHYSSAMPMSLDLRYANYPEAVELMREGTAICLRLRTKLICGPVEWMLLQRTADGVPAPLSWTLAKDGANVEEFSEVVFADAIDVLICQGSSLTLSVCGNAVQISLPREWFTETIIRITIGLQYADEHFIVVIKDLDSERTHTCPIEIQLKGI